MPVCVCVFAFTCVCVCVIPDIVCDVLPKYNTVVFPN